MRAKESRKPFIAVALVSLAASGTALGQAFPSKPITVIIAGGTGTTLDTTTRMFTNAITHQTGHRLIIDYKGGAGGTIGAGYVAKAAPDGHTVMSTISSYAIAPALYANLSYDPLEDLAPVTQLTAYPFIVVVRASLPVRTLAEYIAYAKANPGKLNYGTSGQGSSLHMGGALLHYLTKTEVTYIHYKTGTQRHVDFNAGRLDVHLETKRDYDTGVKAGRSRGLAVTSTERLSSLPDLPTVAEEGVKGYEFSSWQAILAPGGTPPSLLNQLQKMFAAAGKDPGIRTKLGNVNQTVVTNTPEQFKKILAVQIPRWKQVAKAANIKLQ